MKLYILNRRRLLLYILILLLSVFAIYSLIPPGAGVMKVFAAEKDLPIYSVETPDKAVSITFDCAWEANDIPDILQTLREAGVRASFFVVGQWAEKNPDMIKLMAEEGHDVANHSYSHFRMGSLDRATASREIKQCGDLLTGLTGETCDLFRAPYGDYNNSVLSEAGKLGYYTIQWDVDSLDWKPGISREEIMQRVRAKVGPGSILLFHNDTPHTSKMLADVISELKGRGYSFKPVSELIIRKNYNIDHTGRQKNNT
ncbi:MAG TPA: polysaccharide deacetylase family protein [Clostridia bacterium]|nr:polysaccharide deacetylase family protein [Clostridia bacterium]